MEIMYFGIPREYTPLNDAWVMALVLLCFLILFLTIGHQRKYIGNLSRKFFLPTNKEEKPGQKTSGERSLPFLTTLALICTSGVMLFGYAHCVYDLSGSIYYIWSVLLLCLGAIAGYHLLRWLLYSFANWVFFDPRQRTEWMGGFSLLLVYEAVVTYVLMCVVMFYQLPLQETGLVVAICYGLLRFLFIPYTKRIFFPDFYGFLHLFAYLCTLEILPLLALYRFCMFWGSHLIAR